MNDDSLIIKMMTDAWLAGDKERALQLHEHWMLELTPEFETELRFFLGDDYEECFEEKKEVVQ